MAYQHLWRNLMGGNATDADFRAWGSGMSAAIQALGWVKTADTGQIDWLTVTRPLANGAKMGFEVFRAADSLQASTPWFVRFDYGADPNGSARAGLYIRIGTGTDGAGTLTGAGPTITLSCNVQQTALRMWLFVGDGTRGLLGIVAGCQAGTSDNCWAFFVERSQVKGVPDNRGVVLLFRNNVGATSRLGAWSAQWGTAPAFQAAMCHAAPVAPVRGGHYDTGSIVQPVFYNLGTCFLAGVLHNVFVVDPSAIPTGLVSDVPHDGEVQRFYVAEVPSIYPTQDTVSTTVPYRLAFRWE